MKAPKRGRRAGCIVALVIVLALLGCATAGGIWVWNSYGAKISDFLGWGPDPDYAAGMATGQVDITIVSGDTGKSISKTLFDAGVTKTENAFYNYLVTSGQDPTFVPGVFRLQKQMTSQAALSAILNKNNKISNVVAIPEGFTESEILSRTAEATGLSLDSLKAEAANVAQFGLPQGVSTLEGFLYPATYDFNPGTSAHDVIKAMVDRMLSELTQLGVAPGDRLKTVTLASIVQSESGTAADDPKIARVFLNRLAIDMPLQSDATVHYGAGGTHTVWTTPSQRNDPANKYNTYYYKGLPPGPISSPGANALQAVLQPASGSWLYFVVVNLATGETVFSDTLAQHEAAVSQLQTWCAAPENAKYCG